MFRYLPLTYALPVCQDRVSCPPSGPASEHRPACYYGGLQIKLTYLGAGAGSRSCSMAAPGERRPLLRSLLCGFVPGLPPSVKLGTAGTGPLVVPDRADCRLLPASSDLSEPDSESEDAPFTACSPAGHELATACQRYLCRLMFRTSTFGPCEGMQPTELMSPTYLLSRNVQLGASVTVT